MGSCAHSVLHDQTFTPASIRSSYLDRHQTPTNTTRPSTYYHYYSVMKHTEHTSNRCTKYKGKEDKVNSQAQQTHPIMSSWALECWRLACMYMYVIMMLHPLANGLHYILNFLFKEGLKQSNQLSCLLTWVLRIKANLSLSSEVDMK